MLRYCSVLFFLATILQAETPATGPLRVHPENPRYFTDDGRRAVYLTGQAQGHLLGIVLEPARECLGCRTQLVQREPWVDPWRLDLEGV